MWTNYICFQVKLILHRRNSVSWLASLNLFYLIIAGRYTKSSGFMRNIITQIFFNQYWPVIETWSLTCKIFWNYHNTFIDILLSKKNTRDFHAEDVRYPLDIFSAIHLIKYPVISVFVPRQCRLPEVEYHGFRCLCKWLNTIKHTPVQATWNGRTSRLMRPILSSSYRLQKSMTNNNFGCSRALQSAKWYWRTEGLRIEPWGTPQLAHSVRGSCKVSNSQVCHVIKFISTSASTIEKILNLFLIGQGLEFD